MRSSVLFPSAACVLLLLVSCTMTSAFSLSAPLERTLTRAVALQFGMHVTPDAAENPIDPPERFIGYHVGLDYEIFDDELDHDVPVYAICDGEVLRSGFVNGYGGLLIQRCTIGGESVTVLYGHLDEKELAKQRTILYAGDPLGLLAPPRSHWSDGNRKHLHLGIHRGKSIDYRGYVQTEEELQDYRDPASVLPFGAAGRPVDKFHVPETKR